MKWYLAKLVFRIICGEGDHIAQFDEQLRLIEASREEEAYEKASLIGHEEQVSFQNQKQQLVQWQFVDIPELYSLTDLADGMELYSRIREDEDADSYMSFVRKKAQSIRENNRYSILNLV